jgi:PAS domain-containing protein
MGLLDQPQDLLAVVAGLLSGGLLLAILVAVDWSRQKVSPDKTTEHWSADDACNIAFLFKDRVLIQMTDGASEVFDETGNSETPDGMGLDDWDRVRHALSQRFAALPESPVSQEGNGQVVLPANHPDDDAFLVLDRWDNHARVSLVETAPASLAPEKDESGWLRQAVTGAPYPIWQSDRNGKVQWANTAYKALVERFSNGLPDGSPDQPLFDPPFETENASSSCRISITPDGSVQPYWFDIRSMRLESGWMNYATDVNAVVNAEIAQRNFVQTLTKTFAQLSIGLAIFDRKRQLALFNPALIDLTSLSAEFLSSRPNLLSFFDQLRDRQMMPEPKNYRSWRDQIADLVAAADNGQYRETWTLPSGLTYRISGRPHPDGAVAFLFEDISAEISQTRRFRSHLELAQSALNTLEQSIAVFSSSGVLAFSNTAYRTMWSLDAEAGFTDLSVMDASRHWQAASTPTPVWGDLRDFVVQFGERTNWDADVLMRDGRIITCQVIPMAGGATLVLFEPKDQCPLPVLDAVLQSSA